MIWDIILNLVIVVGFFGFMLGFALMCATSLAEISRRKDRDQ